MNFSAVANLFINIFREFREFRSRGYISPEYVNEVFCYNQGKVLDMWYYYQCYYKTKEEVCSNENKDELRVLETLKMEMEKQREVIITELYNIYERNRVYIEKYFKEERKKYAIKDNLFSPRSIIKVFIDKENDKIHYLFSHSIAPTERLSNPSSWEENSGIVRVLENNGKWCLISSIPQEVRDNRYTNPRINISRAKSYNANWYEKIKIMYNRLNKKIYVDKNWQKCWLDFDRAPVNSFYKSTLIIPITLINNDLTEGFRKFLGLPSVGSPQEVRRAIYGFLCFDSVYEDFFDEKDRCMGYFFADIFSLYLVPLKIIGIDKDMILG